MNVVGIICEFNPFTNGHKYLIDSVRRELSPCAVICIMSGNYVQRGLPAIESKRKRAKDALDNGADLVVSMPTCISVSSAPYFAKGGVKIAKQIGCTHLCFGSTSGNLESLISLSKTPITNIIDGNDILAAEYLRNIGNLIPYTIQINDSFGHASLIRESMNQSYLDRYYNMLLANLVKSSETDIAKAAEISEGLEFRIKDAIKTSNCLDSLIHNIKSKRYSFTRISRALLQTFLGIESNELSEYYALVLAFNNVGRELIKTSNLKLFTSLNPEDSFKNTQIALEIKYNDLWAAIQNISIYDNSDYVCKPYIIGL